MCLRLRKIVNPSRFIDPSRPQRMFLYVPCGHCSECIKQYQMEWRNRTYYEVLRTLSSQDGYILMDTLTYAPGHLPHLSDYVSLDLPDNLFGNSVRKDLDFPCFSRSDLQHFFVRLRQNLAKQYGFYKDAFRYFVTCEYGTKFTRRPHYHILFFVSAPISPKLFSSLVSKHWIHGRTDGVPYRPVAYVENHCTFRSPNKAILNYVTKYVTKQFDYLDMVKCRLDAIKLLDVNIYNEAKDFIRPFHLQSKGYGYDFLLQLYSKEKLLADGTFPVLDSAGFVRHLSFSPALKRKLLYEYDRYNDRVIWSLTSEGFKFLIDNVDRSIEKTAKFFVNPLHPDIDEARKLASEFLFKSYRFQHVSPIECILSSYNISSGLYNYASVDYSLLGRSLYTYSDYGTVKDGFLPSMLVTVRKIPSSEHEAIPIQELSQYVMDCDGTIRFESLAVDKSSQHDDGLDVIKFTQRLENLYKKLFKNVAYY